MRQSDVIERSHRRVPGERLHQRLATTANIYVHTDDDQLKHAAEVLAEAINPSFLPTKCPPEAGGLPTKGAEA